MLNCEFSLLVITCCVRMKLVGISFINTELLVYYQSRTDFNLWLIQLCYEGSALLGFLPDTPCLTLSFHSNWQGGKVSKAFGVILELFCVLLSHGSFPDLGWVVFMYAQISTQSKIQEESYVDLWNSLCVHLPLCWYTVSSLFKH